MLASLQRKQRPALRFSKFRTRSRHPIPSFLARLITVIHRTGGFTLYHLGPELSPLPHEQSRDGYDADVPSERLPPFLGATPVQHHHRAPRPHSTYTMTRPRPAGSAASPTPPMSVLPVPLQRPFFARYGVRQTRAALCKTLSAQCALAQTPPSPSTASPSRRRRRSD